MTVFIQVHEKTEKPLGFPKSILVSEVGKDMNNNNSP